MEREAVHAGGDKEGGKEAAMRVAECILQNKPGAHGAQRGG